MSVARVVIQIAGGDDAMATAVRAALPDDVVIAASDTHDQARPRVAVVVVSDAAEAARASQRADVDVVWQGAPDDDDLRSLAELVEDARRDPALDDVIHRQSRVAADLRAAIAREDARDDRDDGRRMTSADQAGPLIARDEGTLVALARHEERRARAHGLALIAARFDVPLAALPIALRRFDVVLATASGEIAAVLLPETDADAARALAAQPHARVASFPDDDDGVAEWLTRR